MALAGSLALHGALAAALIVEWPVAAPPAGGPGSIAIALVTQDAGSRDEAAAQSPAPVAEAAPIEEEPVLEATEAPLPQPAGALPAERLTETAPIEQPAEPTAALLPPPEPEPEPTPPAETAAAPLHPPEPEPPPEPQTHPPPPAAAVPAPEPTVPEPPPSRQAATPPLDRSTPPRREARQPATPPGAVAPVRRAAAAASPGRPVDGAAASGGNSMPASIVTPAATDAPILVTAPRYRHPPRPADYPPRALDLGLTGTVLVRALVSPAGETQETRVVRSSGQPLLDAAALAAVRRWAFEPARTHGRPVPAWVEVPIHFRLN